MTQDDTPPPIIELIHEVVRALMDDLPEWEELPDDEKRIRVSLALEEVARFWSPVGDKEAEEKLKEALIDECLRFVSGMHNPKKD